MKVTVIGTGYVGLVTGACIADMGNDVVCFDINESKIRLLNEGEIPIYEPGLKAMVERNVAAGRLGFTTDVQTAVSHGVLQFIAVGTPPGKDGAADLGQVLAAATNIGRHMTDYKVIIDKSTVPVGTADKVKAAIQAQLHARRVDTPFSVVSNPEFLKEGAAIDDFMKPDRIIIGADDDKATELMRELYAPFQRSHDRIIMMDIRSAELTKYAANAMLATRISFMNELANLAESLDADIELVRKGIGSDPRIGFQFLYPGVGYGGSCFPKDVQALVQTARDNGHQLHVLQAVEHANNAQKHVLTKKVVQQLGSNLRGKSLAIWGLAFKPDTDDMRDAPSLVVIADLLALGATIRTYDPIATEEAKRLLRQSTSITYCETAMDAVDGADALIIVTEWKEFRVIDFEAIRSKLKSPYIFDGRNLYEPAATQRAGIRYFPIGRKST